MAVNHDQRPALLAPATARVLGTGMAVLGVTAALIWWGSWLVLPAAVFALAGVALTWRAGFG